MLTFGSVCSGIEAASVAWAPLGWKAAWLSEIDRAACEVLAHRFPGTPNHGDMLLLAAKVRRREIPAPDLLVGGTPCQSFSVAGMRRGLDDPRGQLTIAFIDLANAIDEIRAADGLPPVIIVWENVPGVLTHKDNPLGCFLAGLAGEDDVLVPAGRKWTNAGAVFGPERAIAWRVLDAQYFGLAQRRRRVFVVASAREGFDPVAVLLEFDGVRRDSPPRRETGEGVAGTLDARTDGGGFPGTDGACSGHVVPAQRPSPDCARLIDDIAPVPTWWDGRDVSQTLDAVLHKGQTMPEKNRFPAVLQPVTVVHGTQDPCISEGDAFALGRNNGGENVIAFSSKDYGADASVGVSPTLRAGGHAESHANAGVPPAIAYVPDVSATLVGRSSRGGGQVNSPGHNADQSLVAHVAYSVALRGREGGATAELGDDLAGCLRASTGGGDKPHVLAPVDDAVCVTEPVTHTLKAEGFDASEDGTGRGQPIVAAFAQNQRDELRLVSVVGALAAHPGMKQQTFLATTMAVRRLMPVECERLQGFPDGWTAVPTGKSGKPAADGPRYKQLGNSMATNVMAWIGQRIAWQLGHNGGPPLEDPLDAVLG
jgi:DNA (cytosine-5)-methyltransferase 1